MHAPHLVEVGRLGLVLRAAGGAERALLEVVHEELVETAQVRVRVRVQGSGSGEGFGFGLRVRVRVRVTRAPNPNPNLPRPWSWCPSRMPGTSRLSCMSGIVSSPPCLLPCLVLCLLLCLPSRAEEAGGLGEG